MLQYNPALLKNIYLETTCIGGTLLIYSIQTQPIIPSKLILNQKAWKHLMGCRVWWYSLLKNRMVGVISCHKPWLTIADCIVCCDETRFLRFRIQTWASFLKGNKFVCLNLFLKNKVAKLEQSWGYIFSEVNCTPMECHRYLNNI